MHDGISNTRWAPPEITFTRNLVIHREENPIILEQWPGSAVGAICIRLPGEKVIFIGDLATPRQPPFLAEANLPAWITSLKRLCGPEFGAFFIVSGRGGIISQDEIKQQLQFLEKVHQRLEDLFKGHPTPEAPDQLAAGLLADFAVPPERKGQFLRRLQFGLKQYILRHSQPLTNSSGE